jgi:hypothetical protein
MYDRFFPLILYHHINKLKIHLMNHSSFLIKKVILGLFLLIHFSSWSQTGIAWKMPIEGSKKLLSYRKHIVSETFNFVLTEAGDESTIKVLKPNQNGFLQKFTFPTLNSNAVVGVFNERLWLVNEKNVEIYDLLKGRQLEKKSLPMGTKINNIALGYDNTAFVIDNQKNQIHVLSKGKFMLLAEDTRLKTASSMLIIGGRIYIGTESNILQFNIAKKTFSVYVDNLKPVLALDTDHLMHIVALTTESVIRINTKNEIEMILDSQSDLTSLSINPETKKLFLLNKKGIVSAYDYLALTHESTEEWAIKSKRKMKPFDTKDLSLVGSEYIIHSRNDNPALRENVLEGFYPEKGKVENGEMSDVTPNTKTMECAEKSFQAFQQWSKNVPVAFTNTVRNGTPPTFWLMVNDYSDVKGSLQDEPRKASLWYWKRNPSVIGRFPGFWKWEATLNQNGQCELPDVNEANKYFTEFIKSNATK